MIIYPVKSLKGEINIPGDKSISHRAIFFGSIAQGTTEIHNFLTGEDCLDTVKCFNKMGIDIDINNNGKVLVHGKGIKGLSQPNSTLYTGNSGTTTRLLLGLLAGQGFDSIIDGDAQIRKRPMDRVIIPLKMMGAKLTGQEQDKYCPINIKASSLNVIKYELPVASAQLKSALILASLYAKDTCLITEPAMSRNHTELMLNYFGADIKMSKLKISSSPVSELHHQQINIPGDISSAAFFMVAGLILPNSEIKIKNVGINETRTGIIDILKQMGGKIKLSNIKTLNNEPTADIIVSSSSLSSVTIERDIIPRLIDEIPIIAVAASVATGTTIIKDAKELKVKETNRIKTVVTELSKAGIDITETSDGMIITGGNNIQGADFNSYGDHRIAMATAILAIAADTPSTIQGTEAANISFPGFFELIEKLSCSP
jgi:3-phosphoshikimate 1-carboxyvinyltransferase